MGSCRRRPQAALLPVLVLAGLGLAACGASATARSAGTGGPGTDLVSAHLVRGACYTWPQGRGATRPVTAARVPCSHPHLAQVTGSTTVRPAPAGYPSPAEWTRLAARDCGRVAAAFLGVPLDPAGRFAAGGVHPSRTAWRAGERRLACTLVFTGLTVAQRRAGAALTLSRGPARASDQGLVYPAGSCLVLRRGVVAGTVPCRVAHFAESVGAGRIRLRSLRPPGAASFAALATPVCEQAVARYLGAGFGLGPAQALGWLAIGPASWRAGTRDFTCLVDFPHGDGYAPHRGALPRTG